MPNIVAQDDITLGILAGGRAARLGGSDKAWAVYRRETLIERTLHALGDRFASRLVSANRGFERYVTLAVRPVPDRIRDFPGLLAGLDALLAECNTHWLLSVPVDLRTIPADLAARLQAAGEGGAVAQDASGLQPLIALWPVECARIAVAQAFAGGEHAAHRVVVQLDLPVVRFDGADFGNLNTPDDFLA